MKNPIFFYHATISLSAYVRVIHEMDGIVEPITPLTEGRHFVELYNGIRNDVIAHYEGQSSEKFDEQTMYVSVRTLSRLQ